MNGAPGVVAFAGEVPYSVLGFTIAGGKITETNILTDPARLRRLDLTATASESCQITARRNLAPSADGS